jgi:hypothetical protein
MVHLEESISKLKTWILYYPIGYNTLMILKFGKIYITLGVLELTPHLLSFIGMSYLRRNASFE